MAKREIYARIAGAVATAAEMDLRTILSESRGEEVVQARCILIYFLYEAMPLSAYEVRLSEDDTEMHIIRHKFPEMDAKFATDDLDAIAKAFAKASEFIRKRFIRR